MVIRYFALVFFLWGVSFSLFAKEVIVLGVVPQQSASKLASQWIPIAQYLSEKIGRPVQFATRPSIAEFEDELLKGKYDVSYMNPYHYSVFSKKEYTAIAKAKDKVIKGILVVKKDSNINSIDDLSGESLAFPSPAAFAATILPQAYLNKHGVDIKPVYVRSHDSVYINVVKGIYLAGGGVKRTLNATSSIVKEDLRILWESKGFTPHAIAVKKEMEYDIKDALKKAFQQIIIDKPHLLEPLKIKGFSPATDLDWDDVRNLDITIKLGSGM